MAIWIERVLNDAVLGFLALLSLFLMVTPAIFSLDETAEKILLGLEYLIILLFGVEYLAGLALAPEKRRYMTNRWRVIDALIIAAALFTLFPFGPEVLRNSPALRLLRLGRLALLGTRSGLALKTVAVDFDAAIGGEKPVLKVHALGETGTKFEEISWPEGLDRIRTAEPDWLFISGVTEEELVPIADALKVPGKAVQGLFKSTVPRFDRLEHFSTLFVRYPIKYVLGERLRRTPVLLVGTAENVVVLCKEQTDLEQRVEIRLLSLNEKTPRMVRAMVALIGEIVRAYTNVLEHLETSLVHIEMEQPELSDEAFLARTFELRADILRVRSSLKHLRSVIRDLSQGQVTIAGTSSSDQELFSFLADDANDLFDGIEDLREALQALVDLRLNVSSFQMNRVMRLLALLTVLALIPATAGGLLGMNLADAPWTGTLAQVAFGVAVGMSLSLYVFAIKGWLR